MPSPERNRFQMSSLAGIFVEERPADQVKSQRRGLRKAERGKWDARPIRYLMNKVHVGTGIQNRTPQEQPPDREKIRVGINYSKLPSQTLLDAWILTEISDGKPEWILVIGRSVRHLAAGRKAKSICQRLR